MRTAYNKTMKHTHRSLIIILAILFSACGPANPPPINLNNLEPLPTSSGLETTPLRVAIAAVISPQGALESYSPLLDYLETKLGRPVERIQGSTYAETNEVLQSGLVDIAFVCTGAYIKGSAELAAVISPQGALESYTPLAGMGRPVERMGSTYAETNEVCNRGWWTSPSCAPGPTSSAEFGMEILAVPEMDGESVYYSWVIVPANSSAQEVEDLRGSTFAFTDPLSLTGWMYPNYLLSQRGQRSEAFFSQTFFTYSHDRAIHAVADGFADGAAVDSLIFNYLIARNHRSLNGFALSTVRLRLGCPRLWSIPESSQDYALNCKNCYSTCRVTQMDLLPWKHWGLTDSC
jgi:ABC-type phosphate/phosphonate transport system substrate-binding protein